MEPLTDRTQPVFQRYVAIGDSQTEGLHDYHEDGSPRGWADRFAETLAERNPEFVYANLAVRGKRTHEVRADQLEAALSLDPDLATVVSGVNDVLRPGADLELVAADLEAMYHALSDRGVFVMGCTFPLPRTGLSRRVAPRLQALNGLLRSAAERQGVLLVELEGLEMAADLRFWSADRVHLNAEGHTRLASGFASLLGGGVDGRWKGSLPDASEASRIVAIAQESVWAVRFLAPKLVRLIRGKSSGDGRVAKRPELLPIRTPNR